MAQTAAEGRQRDDFAQATQRRRAILACSVAIFGGFAPVIAGTLVRLTGDPISPAYYVMAAGLVSGISVMFVIERSRVAALA